MKKGDTHTEKIKLKMSRDKQPKYRESSFNYLLGRYKHVAREGGRIWDISKEDFRKLTSSNCFYCGSKPSNISKRPNRRHWGVYLYNGIDRVNSNNGYKLDNVVPCCTMCNRMKLAWAQEEFFAKIKQIYEYLGLGE